nr:GFA family protein [Gemmobacter sp. 24YEA27]
MGDVGACHCGQCRKLSGHYSASFWAAEDSVTWTARETREYATRAAGGVVFVRNVALRCGFAPKMAAFRWRPAPLTAPPAAG